MREVARRAEGRETRIEISLPQSANRLTAPSSEGAVFVLAATAVVVTAAIVAAAVAATEHGTAAAVAQQEDQDDDPANITAAETVIVTHKIYLREILQRHQPLIPRYSREDFWCKKRTGYPVRFSYATGVLRRFFSL